MAYRSASSGGRGPRASLSASSSPPASSLPAEPASLWTTSLTVFAPVASSLGSPLMSLLLIKFYYPVSGITMNAAENEVLAVLGSIANGWYKPSRISAVGHLCVFRHIDIDGGACTIRSDGDFLF